MHSSKYKDMRFYTDKEIRQITDDLEKAVTIPVNIEIEAEHRVYDLSEMKEILEKAERIAVQECGCKTDYGNCNAPRDVCLSLDETADEILEKDLYTTKEIDIQGALDVLKRSHEAGLVHMAYTMKGEEKPSLVCSCCPCCCHTLGSLTRKGIHTQILTSNYIASDDGKKCNDCEKCVGRCVFQARWMDKGNLVFDQSKCFGCGLCVSMCPMGAINLVPRKA